MGNACFNQAGQWSFFFLHPQAREAKVDRLPSVNTSHQSSSTRKLQHINASVQCHHCAPGYQEPWHLSIAVRGCSAQFKLPFFCTLLTSSLPLTHITSSAMEPGDSGGNGRGPPFIKATWSLLFCGDGDSGLNCLGKKKKVGRLNNLPFFILLRTYHEKVKIGMCYL